MALAKSWDGSLGFQQKRGWKARCESDELVVDGRLVNSQECFNINIFYKTVDTALMQLTERFKGQPLVTSLLCCFCSKSLATLSTDLIKNAARVI